VNSLIESEFPLHLAQRVRYDLLDVLTDVDLAYKLPGDNPTLGELCREFGEIEHSYLQSFKTFRLEWASGSAEPALAGSVAALRAWWRALDDEFESVVRGFSEDDLHQKQIDRGGGFTPSPFVQFQIFREAILIFCAKASVYAKALQKYVSDDWQRGIG
jgi:hypothetical protein